MYIKIFLYSLVPIIIMWLLSFLHHYLELKITVDSWYYFPLAITYSAIGALALTYCIVKIVNVIDQRVYQAPNKGDKDGVV